MKQFFLSLIFCLVAIMATAQTTYFREHLVPGDPWRGIQNIQPEFPINVNTQTGIVDIDHVLYQYTLTVTSPVPYTRWASDGKGIHDSTIKGTAVVLGLEPGLNDYEDVDRTPDVYENINIYHTITLYFTDDLDDIHRDSYDNVDVEVISIQDNAFQNNQKIRSVHIEEGISSIGNNAFAGSSITEVSIPQGLTNVGQSPFAGCSNLVKMRLQSQDPANYFAASGNIINVFSGVSNSVKIDIPAETSSKYKTLFQSRCGSTTSIARFSNDASFTSNVTETFMATYYRTVCLVYEFFSLLKGTNTGVSTYMTDYSRGHLEVVEKGLNIQVSSGRYYDYVQIVPVLNDAGWYSMTWTSSIPTIEPEIEGHYGTSPIDLKFYYKYDSQGNRVYEKDYLKVNGRWGVEFSQKFLTVSSDKNFTESESGEYSDITIRNTESNGGVNITADPGVEILASNIKITNSFSTPVVHYFSYPFDFSFDELKVRFNSTNSGTVTDVNSSRYNNTGDPTQGGWSLYQYIERKHAKGSVDGYAYVVISDPDNFDFKRGIGYAFVGFDLGDTVTTYEHSIHKTAGTFGSFPIIGPKVEDYTITDGLSYTENSESSAYSGWNLLGNPFYASISERDYLLGDHDDWENFVGYVSRLDENNNFERSRTYSSTSKPVASNDILFVKIPNSNPLSLTVRAPGSTTSSSKPKNLDVANITLSLSRSGDFCDKTHIAFNETANEQFVENEDLNKMVEPGAASLYSFAGTTKCEFNVYGVDEESVVVPLGLKVWQNGSFTFSLDKKSTKFDGSIVLVDNQKGTRTNLTNSKYTTNLSRGDIESRFYLEIDGVIAEPQVVTGMETEESGVVAYVNEGVLTVEGIELLSMITVTDAAGHRLVKDVAAGAFTFALPARGIYFATVNGETYKVVY